MPEYPDETFFDDRDDAGRRRVTLTSSAEEPTRMSLRQVLGAPSASPRTPGRRRIARRSVGVVVGIGVVLAAVSAMQEVLMPHQMADPQRSLWARDGAGQAVGATADARQRTGADARGLDTAGSAAGPTRAAAPPVVTPEAPTTGTGGPSAQVPVSSPSGQSPVASPASRTERSRAAGARKSPPPGRTTAPSPAPPPPAPAPGAPASTTTVAAEPPVTTTAPASPPTAPTTNDDVVVPPAAAAADPDDSDDSDDNSGRGSSNSGRGSDNSGSGSSNSGSGSDRDDD